MSRATQLAAPADRMSTPPGVRASRLCYAAEPMPSVRRLAAALTCLLAAASAAAETTPPPRPSRWLEIHTYDPEGPFVALPAQTFGMTTLIVVGGGAAMLCMPFDFAHTFIHRGDYGAIAESCGSNVGQVAASGTYLAGGAPFFVLKKMFWDAPRMLFGGAAQAEQAAGS